MSMTVEGKLKKIGIYINLIGVLLGSQVINGDPTVPQVLTHDQIRYSGCHL